MRKILNQCNFYIILWCIYLLQGIFYESGSLLSVAILAIILLMSFFHFYKLLFWKRIPVFFRGLEVLLMMFVVYGILLVSLEGNNLNGFSTFNYLKHYLISLLPIFSCYYYSRKGILTRTLLLYWVPVFFVVAIFQYYREQREALEALLLGGEDVINNAGYIILSLIPCLYVFKQRWIQLIGLLICLILIMYCMKRGAIVVVFISTIVYVYQHTKSYSNIKRVLFLVGIAIVAVGLSYYFRETLFQNDFFNQRMEETLEGNTSSRDVIISDCLNVYWNKFSFLQQLFGAGGYGTLKTVGRFAHNDWIQTLIDQGLLGLTIFITFWLLFVKTIKNRKFSEIAKNVLQQIFIITLLKTFFSMSIGDITFYTACIWGWSLNGGFDNRLITS